MKNYLIGLLIVFSVASCTTKKEEEKPVEVSVKAPVVKHMDVTSTVIGENTGGQYRVEIEDSIVKYLEGRLREGFGLSDSISFSKFKIIKTITQGEAAKDSYLLVTDTSDKLSSIAVIVNLKDDKFYFTLNNDNGVFSSEAILCKMVKGNTDCYPAVFFQQGKERLICGFSGDCEKTGSKVWW